MGKGSTPPITLDLLADNVYMRAVCDMAQRIDRILAGSDTITVGVQESYVNAPAYQTGSNFYYVPRVITTMATDPSDEREVLPLLLALNLHEYGHFDFTPSPQNKVWTAERVRCMNAGKNEHAIWQTLNGLEDQRQELLVSARFPRARSYFRLWVLRAMLGVTRTKGSIPAENYLLYHGRRHILPRPLLDRVEASLAAKYGPDVVAKAKTLIEEYVRISATSDDAILRMWQIAEEMQALFHLCEPTGPSPYSGRGEGCFTASKIGARTDKRLQDKMSERAGRMLDQIDIDRSQPASEDVRHETDEPTKDDSDDTNDANGNDDDNNNNNDDNDDSAGAEDSQNETTGESSAAEDMVLDYIDRATRAAGGDIETAAETIRTHIFGLAALRLSRQFKLIGVDLGAVEKTRLRRGKLDVRRIPAYVATGDDRAFRYRRQDIKDEAAMLVHVMLDSSGSMSSKQKVAADATSTIARALTMADHHVKVSVFGSEQATAKDWHEPDMSSGLLWLGGGTVPLPLLKDALNDFRKATKMTNASNRVVIMVTDGDLYQEVECAAEFNRMVNAGVHVILIGIDAPVATYAGADYKTHEYRADAKVTIKNVNDLERELRVVTKTLAAKIAREALRRHGE